MVKNIWNDKDTSYLIKQILFWTLFQRFWESSLKTTTWWGVGRRDILKTTKR